MPLSDGLPRPDLAADREALSLAWPEIVKRLTEIVEGVDDEQLSLAGRHISRYAFYATPTMQVARLHHGRGSHCLHIGLTRHI